MDDFATTASIHSTVARFGWLLISWIFLNKIAVNVLEYKCFPLQSALFSLRFSLEGEGCVIK